MSKKKIIKISLFFTALLFLFVVTIPKVYLNNFLHNNQNGISINADAKLDSQSPENSDFDEYNKPVFFNIFKFVNNFIPVKPQN